jgi:outer membrane protein OmpA-like peptidoglycan-associated protein
MVCSFRIGGLIAAALSLALLASPAKAQQFNPDEPLPPGTKATILALTATTEPLKPTILPLKATVLELRGIGGALKAQVGDVQGALKDLGATVKGREIKINLAADVLFDFDKWDLRPEAGPALDKVVAVLQAYPKAAVLIEGHTDGKGNDQYNQKLSERRADSVRSWLAAHGVGAAMTTHGWGKSRPVAPNTRPNGADDPEGRQKNRRVEITVRT